MKWPVQNWKRSIRKESSSRQIASNFAVASCQFQVWIELKLVLQNLHIINMKKQHCKFFIFQKHLEFSITSKLTEFWSLISIYWRLTRFLHKSFDVRIDKIKSHNQTSILEFICINLIGLCKSFLHFVLLLHLLPSGICTINHNTFHLLYCWAGSDKRKIGRVFQKRFLFFNFCVYFYDFYQFQINDSFKLLSSFYKSSFFLDLY